MAKQGFPTMKTGGGALPKVIGTLVVFAVLALVVKQPVEAAHLAKNLGGMLLGAVDGMATFINQTAS